MTASTLGPALRHVHALFDRGTTAGLGDADLLGRFAESRDESAFEALVERHGPMVLAACRAILRDAGGAEDAFQATFLTLARRAGSIRDGEALAGWLHRVARRVALRALGDSRARREHERVAGSARAASRPSADDPAAALHEEIDRLPDRYRLPLVLCHLEGLTHAEAARRLRRGERTLRRHLAEALPRLKDRLVGRGVTLSAAAFAALLAGQARANVPAALVGLAARVAGPGRLAPGVAALAASALRAWGGIKLSLASVAAAGLLASAAWLAGPTLAWPGQAGPPDGQAMAPRPPAQAQATPPPVAKAEGVWTYSGRVVDPDGRPFAGARINLTTGIDAPNPIARPRAISDADGRFSFTLDQKGWGVSSGVVKLLFVTAQAEGFGLGLSEGDEADADRELTVRLRRDDVPIAGRVLDLEGRPVAGARVRVLDLWSGDSDLGSWIESAKRGDSGWPTRQRTLPTHFDLDPRDPIIPAVVTGPDGRFRLLGIGRERLVTIRVDGPTVRLALTEAMTRATPSFRTPEPPPTGGYASQTILGANFDLILPPSRPIEGVVRDQDTGRPIAGAILTEMRVSGENISNRQMIRVTSDARGHYRLEGLPKGAGNTMAIVPPPDQPYLPAYRTVGDSPGLNPEILDVPLKRGIWVRGKLRDEVTGKAISGAVSYHIATENRHFAEVPDFRALEGGLSQFMRNPVPDGSYQVAVLPGPGLLSLRTAGGPYLVLKDDPDQRGPVPGYAPPYWGQDQAHVAINPAEGSGDITLDFSLNPGRSVRGTVLDPEGRPVPRSMAYGCDQIGVWRPLDSAEFTVEGLKAPRPGKAEVSVTLLFRDDARRLAGWRDVKHDEPGPIAVRLAPWAEATGRVVGKDGRPIAHAFVKVYTDGKKGRDQNNIEHHDLVNRTDADGRFRVAGLAPGLAYGISIMQPERYRWVKVEPIPPGGSSDLGMIDFDRD